MRPSENSHIMFPELHASGRFPHLSFSSLFVSLLVGSQSAATAAPRPPTLPRSLWRSLSPVAAVVVVAVAGAVAATKLLPRPAPTAATNGRRPPPEARAANSSRASVVGGALLLCQRQRQPVDGGGENQAAASPRCVETDRPGEGGVWEGQER